MTLNYEGRTAVVTGATRGIGRAIAARFAKLGAVVIGTGTRPEAVRLPDGCNYRCADFSTPDGAETFARELKELAPDILINNAGINRVDPFARIALEDFMAIQQVNLTAAFQLCQAVVPGMRKKGWGRIVNIASIWSLISKAQRAAYSASKFGLDGMTAALAAEVAGDGILANCVSPGFIDTELTRRVLSQSQLDDLVQQVPAKRLGTPEEIAVFVSWLAGPENTFISGQNIAVDGGFTRV